MARGITQGNTVVKQFVKKPTWKEALKDICEVARISLHNLVSSKTPPLPMCYANEFERAAILLGKDEVLELIREDYEKQDSRIKQAILKAKKRVGEAKDILKQFEEDIKDEIAALDTYYRELEGQTKSDPQADIQAFMISAKLLKDGGNKLMSDLTTVIGQITRQEELLGSLTKQVYEDPLTGVMNRRAWDKDLQEIEASITSYEDGTFTLVIVDLDKFKEINDSYGHLVGDAVLKQFARLLKEQFESSGTVYRYGGDEFAILSPGFGMDEIIPKLNAFRTRLKNSVFIANGGKVKIKLTASIGASQWNIGKTITQIIQEADKMLYEAKESGRDCIKYFKE